MGSATFAIFYALWGSFRWCVATRPAYPLLEKIGAISLWLFFPFYGMTTLMTVARPRHPLLGVRDHGEGHVRRPPRARRVSADRVTSPVVSPTSIYFTLSPQSSLGYNRKKTLFFVAIK